MTDARNDGVIDLSIRRDGRVYTVSAPGTGIEVSAGSRDDALRLFAAELSRVQTVMSEHGFELRAAPPGGGGEAGVAVGPTTGMAEKTGPFRRLSVFWQCVIFTLLVLLGINQLILVPALDRAERITLYIFGETSRNAGMRQIGRVVIDRIVELAKATDEITPERREQLRKALRTIAQNSRPMIEALTSEGPTGDGEKKSDASSGSKGNAP